jgi:hypothetical protein
MITMNQTAYIWDILTCYGPLAERWSTKLSHKTLGGNATKFLMIPEEPVLYKGKGKAPMRPSTILTSQSPAPPIMLSSSLNRLSTNTNQFATLAEPTATQAKAYLPVGLQQHHQLTSCI